MLRKNITKKVINVKFENEWFTFEPEETKKVPRNDVVINGLLIIKPKQGDSEDNFLNNLTKELTPDVKERVKSYAEDLADDGKRNYSPRKRRPKKKTFLESI